MIIRLLVALFTIAFSLPVFLFGCNKSEITEGNNNLAPKATIPRIDASAPIKVETATFALG